jgi:hypothetical protein
MPIYLLRSRIRVEVVMPAWIAGIQVYRTIHVELDSSIPCWNDDEGGESLADLKMDRIDTFSNQPI